MDHERAYSLIKTKLLGTEGRSWGRNAHQYGDKMTGVGEKMARMIFAHQHDASGASTSSLTSTTHQAQPVRNALDGPCVYMNTATGRAGPAFFMTSERHIGMAPGTMKTGDKLVVPFLDTPDERSDVLVLPFFHQPTLILRSKGNRWTFHDLAYVHGIDRLPLRRQDKREFVLC